MSKNTRSKRGPSSPLVDEDHRPSKLSKVGDGDGEPQSHDGVQGPVPTNGDSTQVPLLTSNDGTPDGNIAPHADVEETTSGTETSVGTTCGSSASTAPVATNAVHGPDFIQVPAVAQSASAITLVASDNTTGATVDNTNKETASPLGQTKIGFQTSPVETMDLNGISIQPGWKSKDVKRFVQLSAFSDPNRGVYNLTMEPSVLSWDSNNVKTSRLRYIDGDRSVQVKYYILGTLSWNGCLPRDGNYPARAKISIRPIRERDLMRGKQIYETFSKSKKPLGVEQMSALSAHCDMNMRTRGQKTAEAKPFTKLYDGRNVFLPDKENMALLTPEDLIRGDIVLLEVFVGRFWDMSHPTTGKVTDFDSHRVFFRLDACTLLADGPPEDEQVTPPTFSVATKEKVVL